DPGYPRFFAAFSLFVFSMCMLVLAGSFLMLFVFWEAVGLCSYLLIGFWFKKPSAAAAAKKAFVVNRIGDLGLLVAMFLIWTSFGSLNFDTVLNSSTSEWKIIVGQLRDDGTLTAICLCLFLGAMGKSAQFPLHVWLPDAMEGPTPASALIHAATMVTAGVYLVARCTSLSNGMTHGEHKLFFTVIFGIAVFTALLTAFYTFRAYFMTFWGPEKFPAEAGDHPHEATPIMAFPLGVLAIFALGVGLVLGPMTNWFGNYLSHTMGLTEEHPHLHWGLM